MKDCHIYIGAHLQYFCPPLIHPSLEEILYRLMHVIVPLSIPGEAILPHTTDQPLAPQPIICRPPYCHNGPPLYNEWWAYPAL